MDYERCVLLFLCTLTSLSANKLPPNRLPPLFLHYNSKTCQLPLKQRCAEKLSVGGGGVLTIQTTTSSNSTLLPITKGHRINRGHFSCSMTDF